MSSKDRQWRKVVHRKTYNHEKASLTSSSFSWSSTQVHEITLECGHVTKRRGLHNYPKYKAACKDCERGKEPVALTVEPGVTDLSREGIDNKIARALLDQDVKRQQEK